MRTHSAHILPKVSFLCQDPGFAKNSCFPMLVMASISRGGVGHGGFSFALFGEGEMVMVKRAKQQLRVKRGGSDLF